MSTAAETQPFRFTLEPDSPTTVPHNFYRWRYVRLGAAIGVALITVLIVLLVAFAFPARIIGGSTQWTTRAPLASGLPAAGDYVVYSETPAGLRSNTRIVESLFRQHNVARIIAAPGDALDTEGGFLTVNGQQTSHTGQVQGGARLSGKYLIVCQEGGCKPGTTEQVPTMYVLGTTNYSAAPASE